MGFTEMWYQIHKHHKTGAKYFCCGLDYIIHVDHCAVFPPPPPNATSLLKTHLCKKKKKMFDPTLQNEYTWVKMVSFGNII